MLYKHGKQLRTRFYGEFTTFSLRDLQMKTTFSYLHFKHRMLVSTMYILEQKSEKNDHPAKSEFYYIKVASRGIEDTDVLPLSYNVISYQLQIFPGFTTCKVHILASFNVEMFPWW